MSNNSRGTSEVTLQLTNAFCKVIPDNTPKIEVLRAAILIAADAISQCDDTRMLTNYALCLLKCDIGDLQNGLYKNGWVSE